MMPIVPGIISTVIILRAQGLAQETIFKGKVDTLLIGVFASGLADFTTWIGRNLPMRASAGGAGKV
jgi:hypothetical protein